MKNNNSKKNLQIEQKNNTILIDEIKGILENTSMKEKYEGLLKRELTLPLSYKILFKKFELLEKAISAIKKSKNSTNLQNIQNFFNEKKVEFKIDDFQKILYVVPHFFIYKWEKIQNSSKGTKNELVIDIPHNIQMRLQVN